jgi:hypothetical protein
MMKVKKNIKTFPPRKYDALSILFFRWIIKNTLPRSLFCDPIPKKSDINATTGKLDLEIVSHCWQYANMLTYQLSSFINYPPTKANLTVTVFYSEDDTKTRAVLDFFACQQVKNVTWNFTAMDNQKLFRRGIGRNLAARATKADWIWYTDCDIIFHENCLDSLVEKLQGSQETLYFPEHEKTTEMLSADDPMLRAESTPQIVDINTDEFSLHSRDKAKGAFQIVHGDIARAIGYCEKISIFQTESTRWRKTYEDTAFRWLVSSNGIPIDIDGVCQIRHVQKGRYAQDSNVSKVRSKIRRMQE